MDYIAQLPGKEDPTKWYDRFPGLAAARDKEAEEKAPIEMMIAHDNWKWMPVHQSSWLTERQDEAKAKDRRVLAHTQFGKRLLILSDVEASGIIPAEEGDVDNYIKKGACKDPTATTRMLDQEEKKDAQWMECRAREFCELAEVYRRRADNRKRSGAWRSRPREVVSRRLAKARITLVGVIAMLTVM